MAPADSGFVRSDGRRHRDEQPRGATASGTLKPESADEPYMTGRPLDVLEEALDTPVTVHLKDDTAHFGVLAGYDQHMNIVLDPTELEGSTDDEVEDTTIIRGDNVVSINV